MKSDLVAAMSGMFDPLNHVEKDEMEEEGLGSPNAKDDRSHEASICEADQASTVLKWSTERVKSWLQQNVSFEHDRMQEFLHTFRNEGIDGLGLLTLQRSHRACAGMSDSEWLLLKASRRRLLTHGEKSAGMPLSRLTVEEVLGAMTPPSTPPSIRINNHFGGVRDNHGLFGSPRKWSIPGLRWSHAKDDQLEHLKEEVQSLRGEIVGAEERETTLQAQLSHLDEVLRTSQLSGYIHTRTRWTALPGEPAILDDTDVDDWMLRFLVLRGSTICFYLCATDLRPQGTILLTEIVEAGPIPRKMHHKGDRRWSAFHITTVHGLRLECSSLLKVQIDSWLTSIGASYMRVEKKKSADLERPLSGAWLKVLPLDLDEIRKRLFCKMMDRVHEGLVRLKRSVVDLDKRNLSFGSKCCYRKPAVCNPDTLQPFDASTVTHKLGVRPQLAEDELRRPREALYPLVRESVLLQVKEELDFQSAMKTSSLILIRAGEIDGDKYLKSVDSMQVHMIVSPI